MTAQIPDQLLLDERKFSIAGVNGGELFNPARFGLNPISSFSACWRGYVCQYAVRDGRLVLDQLQVNLQAPGEAGPGRAKGLVGPTINGIPPASPTEPIPFFNHVYQPLNLEMRFTGGLLAGAGFIRELYVHMGFQPAWKYQTVNELIIFDGQVTEVRDVSEPLAAIRAAMAQQPLRPAADGEETDLRAWIRSTFKLNYDL